MVQFDESNKHDKTTISIIKLIYIIYKYNTIVSGTIAYLQITSKWSNPYMNAAREQWYNTKINIYSI